MFMMSHVSQHTTLAPNIVKNIVLLLVCICVLFTISSLHATPQRQSPPQLPLNKATDTIFGNWIIDTSEHISLLQLNRDHSYLHIEFNIIEPQNSVAEWGRLNIQTTGVRFIPSYSSNQQQGFVAYQIEFPKTQMALRVESEKLVFTIDTNGDNIADEQHDYYAYISQSVYGLWHQLSTAALSSLVLLDNGYYLVVNINLHQDPQALSHQTQVEWGRFELQQNQLITYPVFDNYLQQTLSPFSTMPSVFYRPISQQLVLSFEQDKGNLHDHLQLFMR